MDESLAFASALEQAELVRRGKVSPVELVELYFARIERLDPRLNAFVTLCHEEALGAARQAESAPAERPFHGVPIAIKDLTEVEGVRTTFSTRAYASYISTQDVSVVRRLRQAGFVVLGKTNTPEFGSIPVTESVLNGACRSPWDTTRTPGGSSGGSAAAVAAGLCPIAHGNDGGGSIRIPASCCGLFGLKPARGRVSAAPFRGLGLSTEGPLARTVADAAAVLDAIEGYEAGDPYWAPPPERPFVEEAGADPGRLRIAVTTTPGIAVPVDPVCERAAHDAAALLAELGHEVEEATPDWQDESLMPHFTRLWQVGPALYPIEDQSLLEPLNRLLAAEARATSSVEYARSLYALNAQARRIVSFWNDYDLVLTPTLAMPPVPIGWLQEDPDPWGQFMRAASFTPFTPVVNVTGQPAVSLPLAWTEDGLPVGVQLIGRPAGEATLIRVSAQLEQARPWRDRRPSVS